jgi:3-dehydrosphinganine reductase
MIIVDKQWVLITGGSSGIGLALARLFARKGANVAILSRRMEIIQSALDEIKSQFVHEDQQATGIPCDVSDVDAVNSAISQFTISHGTPLILVNSAGITYPGEFHELSVETFKSMMDVNYMGTVLSIKAVIQGMLERGSGFIVNISSMAGVIGTYGYSAYGASKYAIRGLSDVLRAEYKAKGIKVFVVYPPDTDTPQLAFEKDLKPAITAELSENGGLMSPDQVAAIIWQDMNKGRYTILPGLNSWFLYNLSNFLGDLTYPVMDMMIESAKKSIQKRNKK